MTTKTKTTKPTAKTSATRRGPVAACATPWTFSADSMTVHGVSYPASYSLGKDGTLYVFTGMEDPYTKKHYPVRYTFGPDEGKTYADALAASGLAPVEDVKPADPAPAAPVEEVKPADPAPAAPVEEAKPADPAPVQKPKPKRAPRRKSGPRPLETPAPVADVKPEPAPAEEVKPAAPAPAPVEKPWIGTTVSGKGWSIVFDAKVERTCIRFEGAPTAVQKAIVEAAGFYYRGDLKCHVKKLTCKAYRAAQGVAAALKAIA